MLFLVLALLSAVVAPPLYWLSSRTPKGLQLLQVVVGLYVAYIAAFHILPGSFFRISYHAILVGLTGFLVLTIAELRWNKFHVKISGTSLILALTGLALHTLIDGAALARPNFAMSQSELGWAIVLHRLPVCVIFWGLLFPKLGLIKTLAIYGIISVMTIIGFVIGDRVFTFLGNEATLFAVFDAFIAGTLLHVALEPLLHRKSNKKASSEPDMDDQSDNDHNQSVA